MSMSDPIADMLTRIRNATMRQHQTVSMPHSKMKEAVAKVLMDEGYIEEYQILPNQIQPVLRMKLKYLGDRRQRRSVIGGLNRVSKPGRRVYVGHNKIPWILSGLGIAVLTTSRGVMTGQEARRLGVGGEVICEVW
ncbi:MAG: 30S ribosomal protein S8 [Anaerolineae bacterium]|nr:MAG: 30S ribosomal protein S8 [Anaerolineae bacterium]